MRRPTLPWGGPSSVPRGVGPKSWHPLTKENIVIEPEVQPDNPTHPDSVEPVIDEPIEADPVEADDDGLDDLLPPVTDDDPIVEDD